MNAKVAQRTQEQMRTRLAYLDEDEARTVEYAPTDSGKVRRDYKREAETLRAAIAKASS